VDEGADVYAATAASEINGAIPRLARDRKPQNNPGCPGFIGKYPGLANNYSTDIGKIVNSFSGSPGNSRSGGLHAHLDVQAEAGQHVDQHIVLVSRTGPLTTTNRNAAFPVSAGLAAGNYDRLFFEEVRFYK